MTGGRKAHFGLRSSIAGRWMFNTLSVVGVLLIIANVCIYYFTRQYYYGSAETYLVSEANATATVLTRLYEDMAVNYSTEVRELIEGFDKKDKMEMMSINKNGEVTLSSSGFSPDESYNMPDYEAALKSEDGVGVFHGYETGENIIAVTVMIAQPSSSYSALRYVSSMKLIDNQLSGIMLTALLISAGVILVVVFSGMYFVKSICVPLMQISVTAKKLAKGDFSERIARNQQLLLKEECHLDKVVDPSAGSYYVEVLTNSLADVAWKLFLEVEEKGGFSVAVNAGEIQNAVNASNVARKKAVATRREILLGSNQYPNFTEVAADKLQETGSCCCGGGHCGEATIPALDFSRGASEFEALRMTTEKSGKTPKVFMLTIGNLAMRLARSQFSANFFGCAGYKIIDNLGFDTVEAGVEAAVEAGAEIVVLCSSDDEYAELAPAAYKALAGRAEFVVAGAPACADDLKAQGIDQFVNVKSNVLETLKAFNAKLGIA